MTIIQRIPSVPYVYLNSFYEHLEIHSHSIEHFSHVPPLAYFSFQCKQQTSYDSWWFVYKICFHGCVMATTIISHYRGNRFSDLTSKFTSNKILITNNANGQNWKTERGDHKNWLGNHFVGVLWAGCTRMRTDHIINNKLHSDFVRYQSLTTPQNKNITPKEKSDLHFISLSSYNWIPSLINFTQIQLI